jgi:hypothetical protein
MVRRWRIWILPALVTLLWLGGWLRLGQSLARNPPPLAPMALPGPEPWADRELLRSRCIFSGQFVARGDHVLRLCPASRDRLEVVEWSFVRRSARRLGHLDVRASGLVANAGGTLTGPGIAGAIETGDRSLALVVFALRREAPLHLLRVGRGAPRLTALASLKAGQLVGIAERDGAIEVVGDDGQVLRVRTDGPPAAAPLPGLPAELGRVEWAAPRPGGWAHAYALRADAAATHAEIRLVDPPGTAPRPVGRIRLGTEKVAGEWIDLAEGNVLAQALALQPTHTIAGGALRSLPSPPPELHRGLPAPTPLATQVAHLTPRGLRRYPTWISYQGRPAPGGGQSMHGIRIYHHLGDRWLVVGDAGGHLALESHPDGRKGRLDLRNSALGFQVLPATSTAFLWVFDHLGRHVRVNDRLERQDALQRPEYRVLRILDREHLQRGFVESRGGKVIQRSELESLAHALSIPLYLLLWPILGFLSLVGTAIVRLVRRSSEAIQSLITRPGIVLVVVSVLVLVVLLAAAWPFAQATARI